MIDKLLFLEEVEKEKKDCLKWIYVRENIGALLEKKNKTVESLFEAVEREFCGEWIYLMFDFLEEWMSEECG